MSELPGMWDESDLQGGEADCAEGLLIVRKLKEENTRLMRLHADACVKAGDTIGALEARIVELENERDSVKTDLLEFRGGFEFIDQRNNLLEAENAALKKENERLTREAINSFQMFTNADARLSALLVRGNELENQRDHLQRLLALAVEEREALEQGERDE